MRTFRLFVVLLSMLVLAACASRPIDEVYNLKNPSDVEGTHAAGRASVAVAGGEKLAELKNSTGVVLKVKGKQVGLELAARPQRHGDLAQGVNAAHCADLQGSTREGNHDRATNAT